MGLIQALQEARAYERNFKERGLENVKVQVRHSNFAPEKHKAAQRWIRKRETIYLRIGVYLTIISLIVAVAAIYFKR